MNNNVHLVAIEQVNHHYKIKLKADLKHIKIGKKGDFIGELDNNIRLRSGAFTEYTELKKKEKEAEKLIEKCEKVEEKIIKKEEEKKKLIDHMQSKISDLK